MPSIPALSARRSSPVPILKSPAAAGGPGRVDGDAGSVLARSDARRPEAL